MQKDPLNLIEPGDIVEYLHDTCLLPNGSWHEVVSVDYEENFINVRNKSDLEVNDLAGTDYCYDSFSIVKKNSFQKKK